MRKINTESTEAQEKPVGFKANRTPLVVMCVIVFLAAFVRVAFSIGTSIDSDFALSGGSVSTNNLYILSELVGSGAFVLVDGSLYYPFGSVSTAPFLFALLMYPFAALLNVFLSDATLASSIVLAFSGPVFAVAAVIASYFLGKQILKSKLAGYLTALFVALCPVFVKESVFSNGTGTSFIMFLLVLCVFFLFKAIETVGYREGEEATHKKAYGFAAIAGVILAITEITWVDYRAILVPILAVMIVQVLVDRFKGKNPMPMALVYSITVLIAAVAAGVYYGVLGLWDQVASGSVFLAVFISALVAGFAATAKKPWTLTLPIFVIVAVAVLVALYFLMPEFFSCIVSGNPIYDEAYLATLGEQKLTLSMLSTYYGAVTYWFVYLVVLGMLYKVRKNAGSAAYIFTMVWLFVLTLTCGHNATEAAIATPVFALGFAALVCWILKHVDFKAYFSAIRTAPGKAKVRRIIRPAPFVSIIVALLLVVGPNVTYVLDASISSNDVDDYNDSVSSIVDKEPFGALSYYIKTDDSWTVRDALNDIRSDKDGSLISWMDYSADAPLYGGLSSYTDTNGKGAVTASNILLGNAINGASSAAILVNAIDYAGGMTDSVKALLSAAGISAEDIIVIENVLKDVEYEIDGKVTVKYMVTTDVETYGKVSEDISDENVRYLFLTNFLAENYSQFVINEAYDLIATEEDLATPYIMVTGDMMPFYYGYAGIFNEMALLNGYDVDSTNYTVNKFTQFGYYAYYYGIYGFTDAMYDTLLYRTYIGMAPAEAGFGSIYDYMTALSNADASVVMQPGYGLGNYSVVYWQVMYNADDEATSDSDGWVQMDGNKAIAKQMTEGGRINYLSGLPVIVAYDANNTGNVVTGNVVDAGKGEVRISAYDSNGNLGATTFTDEHGDYRLYVKNPSESVLVFYAGSQGLTGGVIIGTGAASNALSISLPTISVDLSLYYKDVAGEIDISGLDVKLTNSVTDEVIDYVGPMEVALGTYDVSIKNGDSNVYTGSFTTSLAATQNVALYVDGYEYKVTLKDSFKQVVANADVDILKDGKKFADAQYDSTDKVYKVTLPKGDYSVVAKDYFIESPSFSVSSASSKSFDVSKGKTLDLPASLYGAVVNFVNDVYRISVLAADGVTVTLPVSEFGKTAYTVSAIVGGQLHYGILDDVDSFVDWSFVTAVGYKDITGTLKNAAGSAVSGTITLYDGDGAMFRASVGSDGTFKVYGVPEADLFVYATNGTTEAYMGKLLVADSTLDITMEAADSISPTVKWDTVAAKYLNVVVRDVEGLTGFDLYLSVNNNGSYKFLAPKSLGMTVSLALEGNMYFKVSDTESKQVISTVLDDTVRSIGSYTLYAIDDSAGTTAGVANQVIKIDVTGLDTTIGADYADYADYYLKIGTVDTIGKASVDGFEAKSSIAYDLGKIVKTGTDTNGAYFATGTYYFDPFASDFVITLEELIGAPLSSVKYESIQISGLEESDVVTFDVESNDKKDGNANATGGKEFLVKTSALPALVTIKNADGTKIQYESVSSDIAKSLKDKVIVKGFVGLSADGTATVKYGATEVEFDVDEGSYELAIYKGESVTVAISVTKDGAKFVSNDVTFTPADNEVRNIIVDGFGTVSSVTATGDTTGVYRSVSVDVPADLFTNNGKSGYFTVKFGDGWESAYATDGTNTISQIYIEKDKKNTAFKLYGYYNSSMYDLGSEEMMITLDGPDYDQYLRLDTDPALAGPVYVNKVDDVISNHAYSYVIEVNNLTGMEATFSWVGNVAAAGWTVVLEHEALGVLYEVDNVMISGSLGDYALPGLNTYRITFVPVTDATNVPALDLSIEFLSGINVLTLTSGSGVTINGTTATIDAEAGNAIVSATDMSASGRGVLNELSGMPTIVWVLFGLAIILAILTIWMASKRGVFARRK